MSSKFTLKNRMLAAPAALALVLSVGVLSSCSDSDSDTVTSGSSAVTTVASAAADEPVDAAMEGMDHDAATVSPQIELYAAMRTLWDQHMQWTWDAVVAFASGSSGTDATIERLLRNQDDIGDAVVPYYGEDAAAQLTALLRTHIEEAVPVLQAAQAGDQVALDKSVEDWYANAAEIGEFLAAANPAWVDQDMPGMMKEHITQTVAYASSVLAEDWTTAISEYGEAQDHMDQMADMLSAGLITQFPDKF
ncbi:MAG TPA: hypothetical protein VFN21_06820 [Acidimicrobiales bacterium]|nr:hypothetical protein [Acidimicrobiales bacterium]